MSDDDATVLETLRLERDALLASWGGAPGTVEIEIRGRVKRVSDPVNHMRLLREMIREYELKVGAATGPAVNYAKFVEAQ